MPHFVRSAMVTATMLAQLAVVDPASFTSVVGAAQG